MRTLILTNFERFPLEWEIDGVAGESRILHTASDFIRFADENPHCIAIANCNTRLTFELAIRFGMRSGPRPAVVAADLILRRPRTVRDRLLVPLKRKLLGKVDHFVHYFRDLTGYESLYGVGETRSSFVPFKANLFDSPAADRRREGEYVLCVGRTLRDFDSFFSATERLPFPAAITEPNWELLRRNGSRFSRSLSELPGNVRVLPDDGTEEGMAEILLGAKLVVLPILKESMAASGCSSCLNAMLLGRCVIGTEGPGFSDVFEHGEVLCVPPEDPAALAEAIERAWHDDNLRNKIASKGRDYAAWAGGEQALYNRIVECVVPWYYGEYLTTRAPQ